MTIQVLALLVALAAPLPQPPPAPSPFGGPAVPAPPGQAVPGQPAPGQASPDTATASIKGRVVGKDSGAPLRHALVRLFGGTPHVNESVTTDDQGRFTFTDLQGGRYSIVATKGGYVSMQFGQKDPLEPGQPLNLAAGQPLDQVDFKLPRGGVITGEIVDDAGEPVTGATVRPMRYRYIEGSRRLFPSGRADQTDDRGMYRLFGLVPGSYYVMAMLNAAIVNGQTSADRSGSAPTFYPGTADSSLASRVTVQAGQEVSGVGFAVASTRTAVVAGRVIDASSQPLGRLSVFLQPAPSDSSSTVVGAPHFGTTKPDGSFKLAGVTPGSYTLIAREMGNPGAAPTIGVAPVTVAGADVTGVVVTMSSGTTVSGTVTIEGAQRAPFEPHSVVIQAQPAVMNAIPVGMASGRLDDEWRFTLKGLFGTERFYAGGLPDGWMVKAARLDGQDITDAGADFAGKDTVTGLQILLTNKLTDVNGMVSDETNKPLTDYTLVIFPVDQQRWGTRSRYIRLVRPDQNGRFETKGLPPSDYYATAVASIERGSETDPDLLQQLSARATKFTLGEGESKTLTLTLKN